MLSLGVVVKLFGEDLFFYVSYVEGLFEGVIVLDIIYLIVIN